MKKNAAKKPMLLLALAAVLLLASTIGSTQAALIYHSENYSAEVTVSNIGVSLLENGDMINYRNYAENGNWMKPEDTESTRLMEDLLGTDTKVIPGKAYSEELKVKNTGAIDSYVRVILTKYWVDPQGNKAAYWEDEEGNKGSKLDLNYIQLIPSDSTKWMKDTEASSAEREIYYYSEILPAVSEEDGVTEEMTVSDALISTVKIDPQVAKELIQTTDKNNIITYVYKYDGYKFVVEAEVQAIQTHNAQEAIKGIWGVDAAITDGSLSI